MNVTFSAEDLEFRDEVRKYFETEFPQDILDKQDRGIQLSREDIVRWHKNIYEKGWAAANWPVEYGGTGWTPVQKYIFADDFYFALRVIKRRLCIDSGSSLIELAQGVFHNGSELKGKSFFFQDILGALLGCLNDLGGGGESVCENN